MNIKVLLYISTCLLVSLVGFQCKQTEKVNSDQPKPFQEAGFDPSFDGIMLPEGYSYQILFQEGVDTVANHQGQKALAKGYHDLVVYLPGASNSKAQLYVSHESKYTNKVLGDGGGGTIFDIELLNGKWNSTGSFSNVDFSAVGGTFVNCGGTLSPNGTIFSAEEVEPYNNSYIYKGGKGILDTTDFNGYPKYINYGFMVEVDPTSKKVVRKHYQMGRFMHEDAHFMPDGKTVYLSDDAEPAVFFKFVASTPLDYSEGQLFAYAQIKEGLSGKWISLPMERDSLNQIRDVAMRMGASLFVRHEWLEWHDSLLYIAETGRDNFDWTKYIELGGKPAHYLERHQKEKSKYSDPYGRILTFNPANNQMKVHLEGGRAHSDSTKHFSNPDCISKVVLHDHTFLVICEDITGLDQGRVSQHAFEANKPFNELFLLDLDILNPSVDDLKRVVRAPMGAECTGAIFSPDNKTMFVNIQHPSQNNKPPFNSSSTIAISGFR